MAKAIRYSFYILLFILYIYSIKFTFFPLTGKVVMAVLGLLLWATDLMKKAILISKSDKKIISIGAILTVWGVIVATMNSSDQYIYLEYFISLSSAFFASYLLYKITRRDIKSLDSLLWVISIAVFIESLITVGLRFIPSLQDFLFSIQEFQTKDSSDQDLLNLHRFIGLGEAVYFGVLPSCAIGALSTMTLLLYFKQHHSPLLLWIVFLVICTVSFLIARYSLIIPLICVVWYLFHFIRLGKYRKIVSFSIIGVFVLLISFSLLKIFLPEGIFDWAFELLEEGSSSSTEDVMDWLVNTHFDLVTFIFGDGLYATKYGYYKSIDIGIYRQIFYGGIIGLGLLLSLHICILKCCIKSCPSNSIRSFSFFLFVAYFATQLKGDKPFFDLFLLIYVFLEFLPSISKNEL